MNLAELKAKMQHLNQRGAKRPNDIWKPKDEHEVRCLPYPHSEDPFLVLHFHYELGESQSVLCPKANSGEDCEVCEFAELLKSWKTRDGEDKDEGDRKADWELFKKIQSKPRVFIPVVERGKEAEGARFWGITPNQADQIIAFCTDRDRLEACGLNPDDENSALKAINGPGKAFDLKVSFAKPGEKGNTKSFPSIKIDIKFKPTPLLTDKEAQKKLLDSVKNINDVYQKVDSKEVSRILKVFLNSSKSEAKAEGGVEYNSSKKEAKPATSAKENAAKVGGRTVDEAFDEMISSDQAKA